MTTGSRRMALLAAVALAAPPPAAGHPSQPPPVAPGAEEPAERPYLIPEEDRASYRSRVTAIAPPIPGLEARVLEGQDLLEVRWSGRGPLHVLGYAEEPIFRLERGGIYVNVASPTTWHMSERFGRVRTPPYARYGARPRWGRIEDAGPWRWADHRIHWMQGERPTAVGDGSRATTIFRWRVPLRTARGRVRIEGVLDWIPDAAAIREERSEVSNPLLSGGILVLAMLLGGAGGVLVERRLTRRKHPVP